MRYVKRVTGILAVLLAVLMCMPVMAAEQLGTTEEAYWDGSQVGVARWKKVDKAKEYQVRLYENGDIHVKSLTVSGTRADFSSYMKDGTWYNFSVRAVPKSSQKNYTAGEWADSDEYQAVGLGDTSGKWRTFSQGKKYQKSDGTYAAGQWYQVQSSWYYFDQDGFVLTGWQQLDSNWYYLNEEGAMQTGWLDSNGNRYFLEKDGSMATGWKQVNPGEWYYMDSEGRMLADTEIDGYRLNESGMWVP